MRAMLWALIAWSVACSADTAAADVLPAAGVQEQLTLGGDAYRVEWLARETFDADLSGWFVEGDSDVRAEGGKLWVHRKSPEQLNQATVWFLPELPRDCIVRFRACAVEPAENNAANLNLFLHARELDGSPLKFGRSGAYKEYHQIPNYIVTFTGGIKDGWTRARRDPGFYQLSHMELRSEVGREYDIAVILHNGRLRYYVDGKRFHDVQDPEPLPGGRFGIRTWSTDGWWDDVRFGRLLDAEEPTQPEDTTP